MSERYNALSFNEKKDLNIRTICGLNGFLCAVALIPHFHFATDEDVADVYNYHSYVTQKMIASLLGFWFFDLYVSWRYEFGHLFLVHAVCCIFVCLSFLYPFVHYYAGYYLGYFEVSTVFNHIRTNLELLGHSNSLLHVLFSACFIITFSVIRVFYGSYLAYHFVMHMIQLCNSGGAHSVLVCGFIIVFGGILMLLQYYWFGLIVQAVKDFLFNKNSKEKYT